MTRESLAELDAIEKRYQNRPEVLQLRLHHLMRKKKWALALRVIQRLCRVAPEAGAGFLHAGFCLQQLGKTGVKKTGAGIGSDAAKSLAHAQSEGPFLFSHEMMEA